MLDPTSPLPLYQQLADELSQQISAGQYEKGARIPSETELASRYGLGRPTVRQATEVLVRKRILERRRGAGTFVSQAVAQVDLFSLGGTLASFRQSGVAMSFRWLKAMKIRKVCGDTDNPFCGGSALTVERLVSVERKPVLLERFFLDSQLFAGLEDSKGPPESLSQALAKRFRMSPTAGRQSFRIVRAGKSLAKQFRLGEGQPLLLVKRTLDFPNAPHALFAELYCHTDELVFAQEIGEI